MLKNLEQKHKNFIYCGWFLILAAFALSFVPCLAREINNGAKAAEYRNFFPRLFLLAGIGEALLLFGRHFLLRCLGILVTLAKLVLPWLVYWMLNEIHRLVRPGMIVEMNRSAYFVANWVPYIVTALTFLLLVQQVVMLVVLGGKRNNGHSGRT